MSKSRFYISSIKSVAENYSVEAADDIESYVQNLRFERSLLVNELKRANTLGGRELLKELGFNPTFIVEANTVA